MVKLLRDEISNLAVYWRQAAYEVDGITDKSFSIISSFQHADHEALKTELPNWTMEELEMLAKTLSDTDWIDNCLFGYIFTLSDSRLASSLIDQDLLLFFQEKNPTSIKLLMAMKEKICLLKDEKYIDENDFEFWIKQIDKVLLNDNK